MPYKSRKIKGKNLYKVYNSVTGKIHSYGTTLDKAKAQIRLLNSIEGEGSRQGREIVPAETLQSIAPAPRSRPVNIPFTLDEIEEFLFDVTSFSRTNREPYRRAMSIATRMSNILRNGQRDYPVITNEELEHFKEKHDEYLDALMSVDGTGMNDFYIYSDYPKIEQSLTGNGIFFRFK